MSCHVLVRWRMGSNEHDFHGQLLLVLVKDRKWSAPRAVWYKTAVSWRGKRNLLLIRILLDTGDLHLPLEHVVLAPGQHASLDEPALWCSISVGSFFKLHASDCQEKQRGKGCDHNPLHPVSVLMSRTVERTVLNLCFQLSLWILTWVHRSFRWFSGICAEVHTFFWLALCKTDFKLEGDVLKQLISIW